MLTNMKLAIIWALNCKCPYLSLPADSPRGSRKVGVRGDARALHHAYAFHNRPDCARNVPYMGMEVTVTDWLAS